MKTEVESPQAQHDLSESEFWSESVDAAARTQATNGEARAEKPRRILLRDYPICEMDARTM